MKTLETERLILRKFKQDDFDAVHSYADCAENLIYMMWGPNTEEQTRDFINMSIAQAEESPCVNYNYAVELKNHGKVIGGCGIYISDDDDNKAEIGWLLHRGYWLKGYGTEIGEALLQFSFEELNLHRIVARCDAENIGSYRVMEKIGMRREGLFLEARPANKLSDKKYGDELRYAVLKREWEVR